MIATAKIITARPSIIPRIAIRTISFEKVRLELNVMRFAMKKGKFNPEIVFLYLSKDAFFLISFQKQLAIKVHFYLI